MGNSASASRPVVIRASRETLGLVAAATAVTFALSYAVHSKHGSPAPTAVPLAQQRIEPPRTPLQQALQQPQQDWAGHLAELPPPGEAAPSEPLSSASLVVPKAELALPALPPRPPAKPRTCLDQPCPARSAIVAISASRRQVADAGGSGAGRDARRNLFVVLNPFNHLPDMSAVGRPFAYAGSAVSSWIKRF